MSSNVKTSREAKDPIEINVFLHFFLVLRIFKPKDPSKLFDEKLMKVLKPKLTGCLKSIFFLPSEKTTHSIICIFNVYYALSAFSIFGHVLHLTAQSNDNLLQKRSLGN